jgi:hypothetical protein
MGQARVMEVAFAHSAVGCCAVGLRPYPRELWEIPIQ